MSTDPGSTSVHPTDLAARPSKCSTHPARSSYEPHPHYASTSPRDNTTPLNVYFRILGVMWRVKEGMAGGLVSRTWANGSKGSRNVFETIGHTSFCAAELFWTAVPAIHIACRCTPGTVECASSMRGSHILRFSKSTCAGINK
jgi:hypothetical protein